MTVEGNVSMLLGNSRKAIYAMTGPLLMMLLIVQINVFADRAWPSGLGADALLAVSLCIPLYEVITGLGTGLGVGATAVVFRCIEARDHDGASGNALQALLFGFVFDIVLTLFTVLLCQDIFVLIGSEDIIGVSYDYMIWIMAEALRIYSLCIPFYCIIPLESSMLQAMGLPKQSLSMALVRNLVFIVMYAAVATVSLYWIYWVVVFGSVVGDAMAYLLVRKGLGKMGRMTTAPLC